MASYQRYSRGNAPFLPSNITIPLKTIGSKKPKLLRFMEGNHQRRLLAGSPELSDPLPPRYFLQTPGSFRRLGATVNRSSRARSLGIICGWVTGNRRQPGRHLVRPAWLTLTDWPG